MRQVSIAVDGDIILCPIPTASSRRRGRGFDHAKLLMHTYWRKLPAYLQLSGRPQQLLTRQSNTRQLGASRPQRIEQMQDEFALKPRADVDGKTVLLIDDVVTTGATLASAAKTLKNAGAKRVYALVYAQKN